jgi:small conductance mechanosensitive channel
VGDIIDAGGAHGRVEEIQIFNTIIVTNEKKIVIVPNSKITGDKITIDQS